MPKLRVFFLYDKKDPKSNRRSAFHVDRLHTIFHVQKKNLAAKDAIPLKRKKLQTDAIATKLIQTQNILLAFPLPKRISALYISCYNKGHPSFPSPINENNPLKIEVQLLPFGELLKRLA